MTGNIRITPRRRWRAALLAALVLLPVAAVAGDDDEDPMASLTAPMRAVLSQLQMLGWQPVSTLTPGAARHQATLQDAASHLPATRALREADTEVSAEDQRYGSGDAALAARIYRPARLAAPAPVILFFHGGGWVQGSLAESDHVARVLAFRCSAVVISAEYRLAPEHRFPAAQEDAWAAYRWTLANARSLGIDAQHLALAGEDAGGNLAVNVAVRARDSGVQRPVALALITPIIGTDTHNYSYNRNENALPLSKASMLWYLKQVVDDSQLEDKRLNLGDFNLQGLAPTTIVTADVDPLMFEGKLFAHKLESSDVPVRYQNLEGVTHGFFGLDGVLREARQAQQTVAEELAVALGHPLTATP